MRNVRRDGRQVSITKYVTIDLYDQRIQLGPGKVVKVGLSQDANSVRDGPDGLYSVIFEKTHFRVTHHSMYISSFKHTHGDQHYTLTKVHSVLTGP